MDRILDRVSGQFISGVFGNVVFSLENRSLERFHGWESFFPLNDSPSSTRDLSQSTLKLKAGDKWSKT